MRACPRCAVPLAPEAVPNALAGILGPVNDGQVDVDACPRCGGTFLDREEFGWATGNVGLERWIQSGAPASAHGLHCPACGGTMASRSAAGVVVDACASCGGMWFDAGEVEKLADARAPELDRR